MPIAFAVDGDTSMRESLKTAICGAGWHADTLASAGEFLTLPRSLAANCLVTEVDLRL